MNEEEDQVFARIEQLKKNQLTPELLAELQAQAIEQAINEADTLGFNGNGYDYSEEDLRDYALMLRGIKT